MYNNIRYFRRKKNLTQPQLADLLGATFQQVSKWERGINQPRYEILIKIGDILDAPPDQLLLPQGTAGNGEEKVQGKDHTELSNVLIDGDEIKPDILVGLFPRGSDGEKTMNLVLNVPQEWIVKTFGLDYSKFLLIHIRGDGHIPLLSPGDLGFIQVGLSVLTNDGPGFYIIESSRAHDTFIRRLVFTQNDKIILAHANPDYRLYDNILTRNEFVSQYTVIGKIVRVLRYPR